MTFYSQTADLANNFWAGGPFTETTTSKQLGIVLSSYASRRTSGSENWGLQSTTFFSSFGSDATLSDLGTVQS